MKKRIILSLVIVMCLVLAFAGCNPPKYDSYTIPMIDLEDGMIRSGGLYDVPVLDDKGKPVMDGKNPVKNDILYKFSKEELKNEMFTHDTIVADKDDFGKDYMAHPDSILLKRKKANDAHMTFGTEVLTMFPLAHGKGELKAKISYDGGLTYDAKNTLTNTPTSWKDSQETPTLYRLTFSADNVSDDNDLLILTSGNPLWPGDSSYHANGFNVSISAPSEENGELVEGRVWSQFETWYGRGDGTVRDAVNRNPKGLMKAADPIVAMSSLTRLKEQERDAEGKLVSTKWVNKWMGLFHDHQFNLYKTILSFDLPTEAEKAAGYPTYPVPDTSGAIQQMVMHWTDPTVAEGDADYDPKVGNGMYFNAYKKTELKAQSCEVECIRSEAGNGNRLALLMRSNSKKMYSLVTFSDDEGKTWSAPKELPQAISGERHKAEWVKGPNGEDKLFITFRSIERSDDKSKKFGAGSWMSEGYVAWVGSWDDLENGTEGDFRVKLAHTYLDKQKTTSRSANGDTGYCGNVVLPGNKVATCSYGRFSPDADAFHGGHTYILGKVVDINTLYSYLDLIPVPAEPAE